MGALRRSRGDWGQVEKSDGDCMEECVYIADTEQLGYCLCLTLHTCGEADV